MLSLLHLLFFLLLFYLLSKLYPETVPVINYYLFALSVFIIHYRITVSLLLILSSPLIKFYFSWDTFLEISSWLKNSCSVENCHFAYHSTHIILRCVMFSMVFVYMFMCRRLDLTWNKIIRNSNLPNIISRLKFIKPFVKSLLSFQLL